MSDSQVDELIRWVSNWGRWGADDEIGTWNYVTDDVRRAAMASVRTGTAVSLALPLSAEGPQPPRDRRLNPHLTMLQTGTDLYLGVQENSIDGWGYADDMVTMALQSATHWDGLGHAFYDYRMYNDRDCRLVDINGAAKNGIHNVTGRVLTRGVLLDIAEYKQQQFLPLDYPITRSDLERCADHQGVRPRRGDVLLVRTGNLGRALAEADWRDYTYTSEPGLALECLSLLHEWQVAAVAADNWALEVLPSGASIMLPIHSAGIVRMGLTLGENFVLDDLGSYCREVGQYDFLFSADPLPFVRAVGSPIAPLAIL